MEDKFQVRKFNGKNFPVWKEQMKAILKAKDIYKSIEEAKPVKEDAENRAAWEKADRQAQAHLLSSLDDKQVEQISHLSTSRDMWNKLCNVHDTKVKANKTVLQGEFFALSMTQKKRT